MEVSPSYQEYKIAKAAVKAWEHEYRSQHSSRPDRKALSAASSQVQSAYSMYYKLKKKFCDSDVVSSSFKSNSLSSTSDIKNTFGSDKDLDPCVKDVSLDCNSSASDIKQNSTVHNPDQSSQAPLKEHVDSKKHVDSSSITDHSKIDNPSSKTQALDSTHLTYHEDCTDNSLTAAKNTEKSEEVFGQFLNKSKEAPVKKIDRAPLSDLYSKLAQNMRASFLSSPTPSYSKTSLKKRGSSKQQSLEVSTQKGYLSMNSAKNSESTQPTNIDTDFVSSSNTETHGDQVQKINFVNEAEHSFLGGSSDKKGMLDFMEENESFNSIATPTFKICTAPKRVVSCSVNVNPGMKMSSNRITGKINSNWVKRCVGSVSDEDKVTYDFKEDISLPVKCNYAKKDSNFSNTIGSTFHNHKSSFIDNDHKSSTNIADSNFDSHVDDYTHENGNLETDFVHKPFKDDEQECGVTPPVLPHVDPCYDDEGNSSPDVEPAPISRRGKRKAVESIEELEEQGTITSVWPPPKKKRLSRIVKNSSEEIERHSLSIKARRMKVISEKPKKSMQVRGRRRVVGRDEPDGSSASGFSTSIGSCLPSSDANTQIRHESSVQTMTCESSSKVDGDSVPGIPEEYDEQVEMEKDRIASGRFRRRFVKKEDRIEAKLKSGTVNQNFVKIDLKKKKFSRGKSSMSGGQYRRMEWKRKQGLKKPGGKSGEGNKNLTCFKCGDFGHWASRCPGKMVKENYTDAHERGPVFYLTLEEAENLSRGIKSNSENNKTLVFPSSISQQFPQPSITASGNDSVGDSIASCENDTNEDAELGTGDQTVDGNTPVILQAAVDQGDDSAEDSLDEEAQDNDGDSYDDLDDSLNEDDLDRLEREALDDDTLTVAPSSACESDVTQAIAASQPLPRSGSSGARYREKVNPVYNDSTQVCPREVKDTLLMFGHSTFRPGQEEAILRILKGLSTLLVLSTGSGKSLCYQLPAYIYAQKYKCITLCVSPLVSLMEDQVTGLPAFLHAVCLHTNQTPQQRTKSLEAVRSGKVHILLVSPEAVVASGAGGILGTLMKDLPAIGFACVDEAHCVSQWSHNFRPSYLRLCSVLRDQLGVQTILGLTATARHETTLSIAQHLQVQDLNLGIIRGSCVPPNLQLSVSRDANKNESLVQLLQGDRFSNCDSIIVYCTRRDECERVATLLRAQLLTSKSIDVKANLKRNRGISLDADAYHAGLSAARRRNIQKKFMTGKLRIVVATVAFGMGIDKADVRAIIHYNMPKNLESYVQEIGRAGRDGLPSQCHLFLDHLEGRDVQELKRFIFVNSVDRVTVRKLLDKIFMPCICLKLKNLESNENANDACDTKSCPKHEMALPTAELIEYLDLPEENILTLLCYLELRDEDLIEMMPSVYGSCTVTCYGGAAQLCAASRRCPPLAVAIAKDNQRGVSHQTSSSITFPVVQIAAQMGWNSGIVKRELKSLEWTTSAGSARPSGVKVEFADLSFHLQARGNLSDDDRDRILEELHSRAMKQEHDQLKQLQYTHQTLRAASHASILFCTDQVDEKRCSNLKQAIARYFAPSSSELDKITLEKDSELNSAVEAHVRQDIRTLLCTHSDHTWTARAVTRVFHGIQSPNFPASIWGRVRRIWRAHINVPFKHVLSLAQQEIIKWKRL